MGDWVFLKLQPYKKMSLATQKKLQTLSLILWLIPDFRKDRKGCAYKLGLPSYSRLDLVFHVLVLKKKIGEAKMVFKDLPTLNDGKEFKSLPQVVLGWRLKKGNIKVLIHWQWLSLFEAIWEDCNGIKLCFLRWRLKLCFLSRTCVGILFLYLIFELM